MEPVSIEREWWNCMENSLKGLILAAGISITCLVISLGFYTAREARVISSITTEKLSVLGRELQESDYTVYDGKQVLGSDVTNFIKKYLGPYSSTEVSPIYVYVKTALSEKAYVNGSEIGQIRDFTHSQYINPLGKFRGAIIRDENDVIRGISFIVQ